MGDTSGVAGFTGSEEGLTSPNARHTALHIPKEVRLLLTPLPPRDGGYRKEKKVDTRYIGMLVEYRPSYVQPDCHSGNVARRLSRWARDHGLHDLGHQLCNHKNPTEIEMPEPQLIFDNGNGEGPLEWTGTGNPDVVTGARRQLIRIYALFSTTLDIEQLNLDRALENARQRVIDSPIAPVNVRITAYELVDGEPFMPDVSDEYEIITAAPQDMLIAA